MALRGKFLMALILVPFIEVGSLMAADPTVPGKTLPAIPLTLDEVLTWVDRAHPLLKGAGTEKIVAKGKLLRALGAFEPTLVNDTEAERFIPSTGPQNSRTVGFNDTLIEARHPWGFRGSAGLREVINGPAKIPDLGFNNNNNQVLLGGFIPLLRGLVTNPENAELQRSSLADPKADNQIAQTRQGLFFAAATQY